MDWDVVGLAVGSRGVPVTKIFFTVDVTSSIVAEAVEANAELIIAHHPVLLRGISAVTDDHPKGRLVRELVRHDISVFVAHTNADVAAGGVASALADALELSGSRPMVPAALRLDKIITFVPNDHAEAVLDALATAGAGVLGDYDRCAFVTDGSGTFRPLAGSSPYLGTAGVDRDGARAANRNDHAEAGAQCRGEGTAECPSVPDPRLRRDRARREPRPRRRTRSHRNVAR